MCCTNSSCMRSWRKISAKKWAKAPYNIVEATFVLKKSQKISVSLHNSTQFRKKFHWNKICRTQSEEKKQEGKQEESRAKVGQMSTIEKNSICKFVWNLNFLLSVEISMKVVNELGNRNELAKRTWMTKTILPIEIIKFFCTKNTATLGKRKRSAKNFSPR